MKLRTRTLMKNMRTNNEGMLFQTFLEILEIKQD